MLVLPRLDIIAADDDVTALGSILLILFTLIITK